MKDAISRSRGNPKKRLQLVYDVCKAKSICEGGADIDSKKPEDGENGGGDDSKKKVGLCCNVPYERIWSTFRIHLGLFWLWTISTSNQAIWPGSSWRMETVERGVSGKKDFDFGRPRSGDLSKHI